MADAKISALPASTLPLAGTEVLPIVQSGDTKKVSVADLTPGLSTITTTKGGTGLTEFTSGGVVYATSTSALTTGSALTFDGTTLKNDGGATASISVRSEFGTFAALRIAGNANTLGTESFDLVQGADGTVFIFNRVNAGAGIIFGLSNAEVARFNSSGNLAFPAGKGIDFSADPSAPGMTSELLDDYEEGTFTAVRSGFIETLNGGAITSTGTYTKIGRNVTVQILLTCTGGATIQGNGGAGSDFSLPFTSALNYPGTYTDNTLFNTTGAVVVSGANMFLVTGFVASGNSRVFTTTYSV